MRAGCTSSSGPLAQLVEQQTLNLRVPGSSPGRLTTPHCLRLGCAPDARFTTGKMRRLYTTKMNRSTQRVVGVAALVTFAGLPGLGVVCGLMCARHPGSTGAPTTAVAAHASHGSNATSYETSDRSQLRASARSTTHACGDHTTIMREWAVKLTRSRADHRTLLAGEVPAPIRATASAQVASRAGIDDASPPGPSGTRAPLVLRI